MTRLYHISPKTGKPAVCKATTRACPLGGLHFTSEAEALLNAPAADGVSPRTRAFIQQLDSIVPSRKELVDELIAAVKDRAPNSTVSFYKKKILDTMSEVIGDDGLFHDETLDDLLISIRAGRSEDVAALRANLLEVPSAVPLSATMRAAGIKRVEIARDDATGRNVPGGVSDKLPTRDDFASNGAYADMLKGIDISDVRGVLPYTDEDGRIVPRAQMAKRVEELEQIQRGWFSTNPLRAQLLRADATHLRAMKENFRAAYKTYRAENGEATRPDFGAMIEAHEAKVAKAKEQRAASEDIIPLSLRGFFGGKSKAKKLDSERGNTVPAAVIGEFVGEASESMREFFADSREAVGDFIHRR